MPWWWQGRVHSLSVLLEKYLKKSYALNFLKSQSRELRLQDVNLAQLTQGISIGASTATEVPRYFMEATTV